MQFKHPEFLYALFLLLIPIIVHLFHLRKFQKVAFTNVKFLKKVELQTRKSSQLKKWLTLLSRLLALAAVVIAFARPFIPQSEQALIDKETVVYIDNSFSMQQRGEQGELLKQAVQQVLQNLPEDAQLSVLTNDQEYLHETVAELQNDLLEIDYSPAQTDFKTIDLKVKNIFSGKTNVLKQFIAISDFQELRQNDWPSFESDIDLHFIQLKGKDEINFSVDSVYIASDSGLSELEVQVSSNRPTTHVLPVSLVRKDGSLLAKSSAGFDQDTISKTRFSISEEQRNLEAVIRIEDQSLKFDNEYFFNIQRQEKIKVVALHQISEDGNFLKKIYQREEFEYISMNLNELDYNQFENADFIILNELENIPAGLVNILSEHTENGGGLAIIPSVKSDLQAYNSLLLNLGAGSFSNYNKNELQITNINFSHPLYQNVFESEVKNFQYPKVEGEFTWNAPSAQSVLTYNNGRNFLGFAKNTFVFSTAIHAENSNFKQSPLIVPTFYNMAKQSLKLPQLSYTIGKNNQVMIPASLEKDEVLEIKMAAEKFIPQQRRFQDKVELTFYDLPEKAGIYEVVQKEEEKAQLSFNYDRIENRMKFSDLSGLENVNLSHDIKAFFNAEINKNEVNHLWKWFVIFALIFLMIEVILLKFLK